MSALQEWGGVSPSIVTLGGKGDNWVIKCNLCDVRLESRSTWLQHFDSKKHRGQAKLRNVNPAGFKLTGKDRDDGAAFGAAAAAGQKPAVVDDGSSVPAPRSKRSPTGETAEFDVTKTILTQLAARKQTDDDKKVGPQKVPATAGAVLPQAASYAAKVTPSIAARKQLEQQSTFAKKPDYQEAVRAGLGNKPAPSESPTAPQPSAAFGSKFVKGQAPPSSQPTGFLQRAADRPKSPTADSAAGSRQESGVAFIVPVVNANKAKGIEAAPVSVGAPLVDPKLDRTKTRNLHWLKKLPIATVKPTADGHYNATFRIPSSLMRLLKDPKQGSAAGQQASAVIASAGGAATAPVGGPLAAGLPATDSTPSRLRAAFEQISKDVQLEEDREGLEVSLKTTAAINLPTLRLLESFFTAAVCFAPYDEPTVAQSVNVSARVDTSSFWAL